MSRPWITFTTSILFLSCLISSEIVAVSSNDAVSTSPAVAQNFIIENAASSSSDFDDGRLDENRKSILTYPSENDDADGVRDIRDNSTDHDDNDDNDDNDNGGNNNNNATAPTTGPTNAPTPAMTSPIAPSTPPPTPAATHPPTKKYEPPHNDNDDENGNTGKDNNEDGDKGGKNEEKKKPSVGIIFLWIVLIFGFIWVLCYFRDAILFFLVSAWNNTRRYGCKGCMQSFCPCIAGSREGGGGGRGGGSSEPLDQIIFETEDAGLSRGLMD